MPSGANDKDDTKGPSSKSVRFAAGVAAPSKRAPTRRNDDNHGKFPPVRSHKRPRMERPNEDEADDVDDWQDDPQHEMHPGGNEEDDDDIHTPKEVMEARRARREHRHHAGFNNDDEEEDKTRIDATTSLLKEEIAVEPFSMDAEQNDGSGYFDGDTYVFRKRSVDEEPDAWLESLGESNDQVASFVRPPDDEEDDDAAAMNSWSMEELYSKIIPLVSDSESVLQAVARYGELLKRAKKSTTSTSSRNSDKSNHHQMAQDALNELTEAANELLLKGDVDVYQKTRNDFLNLLPSQTDNVKPHVTWEYRGNQDHKVHGPYTTEQMLAWTTSGYFVGAQAVQIRPISKSTDALNQPESTADDLLSDLMEDDDDTKQGADAKGEWVSSNDVDFSMFS